MHVNTIEKSSYRNRYTPTLGVAWTEKKFRMNSKRVDRMIQNVKNPS